MIPITFLDYNIIYLKKQTQKMEETSAGCIPASTV